MENNPCSNCKYLLSDKGVDFCEKLGAWKSHFQLKTIGSLCKHSNSEIFRPSDEFFQKFGIAKDGEFPINPNSGIEAFYTKDTNTLTVLDKNGIPRGSSVFFLNAPEELFIGLVKYIKKSNW